MGWYEINLQGREKRRFEKGVAIEEVLFYISFFFFWQFFGA
jgi:hypothetical protein